MDSQVIAAALATERKCYAALTEVMELTQDLSDAVQRQDQVTVQMFLSMRQEPINQLKEYRSLQRKRCASLPEEESAALWKVLTGKGADGTDQLQELEKLVGQNQSLLERIQQVDRQVSVSLGGKKSFYSK
ncbi:hypothetical protein [Intestinimonas butyriciproducens]|uniref:hypothetical protein n=1 Tax=Intestinimonas butyriciproducens TaxID=1297617 RepID=UPI00195EE721|nr:hypothetical protein [Intestinimonas butyriciproducens]MBM6976145.1 hypothetical protein [Intestinimonas butyriciproducens]